MNYTNTANLPAPLVSAVQYSDYDKGDADISASGLVEPERLHALKERHDAEIVEDVSEGIFKLIGNVGHKILERADTNNHLAEERLYTSLHGWRISGKADLLGPDMILDDYKFTSLYAVKGLKSEWEQQLNLYALLYRKNGFEAKAARIIAVLRDWSKMRAQREGGDYPPVGVVVKNVPLWSPEEQEAFLGERVRAHQRAEKLADDDLPMCTEEERWHKADTWAVKKQGGKRALKLFSNETDARTFLWNGDTGTNKLELEHRPGQDVRCLHYCAVKDFCRHGRSLAPAKDEAA